MGHRQTVLVGIRSFEVVVLASCVSFGSQYFVSSTGAYFLPYYNNLA